MDHRSGYDFLDAYLGVVGGLCRLFTGSCFSKPEGGKGGLTGEIWENWAFQGVFHGIKDETHFLDGT